MTALSPGVVSELEKRSITVGSNITQAGVALVVAAGVTMRTETFNIPLNVAIVPSSVGTRVSVLSGFSMRRR